MMRPAGGEGSYSRLTDGERGRTTHTPPPAAAPPPSRQGVAGPYRLATICLATLCIVLLITIISISAHNNNGGGERGGGERGGGEEAAELQRQTQYANVSKLQEVINKLQEEKKQLERERDELRARLEATKAPPVVPSVPSVPSVPLVPPVPPASTTAPKLSTAPSAPTAPPIVCPPQWHLFNSSCYFVSQTTREWSESKSYCKRQGAYLAIIRTAQEQTFVWELLPRGHWNAFWIGITDEHTEDQWKWVDGTPLEGGFWEEGEPNNHIDEDCGYIVKTQVLERVAIRSWYDAPCDMSRFFICEKDM